MKRRQLLQSAALGTAWGALPHLLWAQAAGDPLKPFYLPPNSGTFMKGGRNVDVRILIRQAQTGGQFSCVELKIGPKQLGPAPHVHKDLDEIMFVQEGTVTVMVGDEIHEVQAGGWHLRPHGLVHTFWNATDQPARAIDLFFNQALEDQLEELFMKIVPSLQARGLTLDSPEGRAAKDEIDARYGITTYHDQRAPLAKKYGLRP